MGGNNGVTLYALGKDYTLRKSTDSGTTWTARDFLANSLSVLGMFLKLADGTLLGFDVSNNIIRSTSDSTKWTTVANPRVGAAPLGSQSWAVDQVTGYIYYGEYLQNTADVNRYRSTDNGLTWTVFYAFPGGATAHADRIAHIHAAQWDHIAQRVMVMTGDGFPAVGMYRGTSDGTSVEPVLTNRMLDASAVDSPRAIGIMPFPDYIAWASDSTANPYLFRMARTEIGKRSPGIEKIYRLSSTSWFTVRASDDGSR